MKLTICAAAMAALLPIVACGGGTAPPNGGYPPPIAPLEMKDRGDTTVYSREEGMERLFAQWGLWAGRGDKVLFYVHLSGSYRLDPPPCPAAAECLPRRPFVDAQFRLLGERTGTNPVSGPAAWTGRTRGFDHDTAEPLEGIIRLEANLESATLDVALTSGNYMGEWAAVSMRDGQFRGWNSGEFVHGDFFGQGHEGVAGQFGLDRRSHWEGDYWGIGGVFGALRE